MLTLFIEKLVEGSTINSATIKSDTKTNSASKGWATEQQQTFVVTDVPLKYTHTIALIAAWLASAAYQGYQFIAWKTSVKVKP